MKKALSILVITLLSNISVQAQGLENALLWEISGNDLQESSYLYGTIHATCNAVINDSIKNALDKTSQLVLELDMDDPGMQAAMMSNIAMKDNQNLKDLLTEEEYTSLDKFLREQFGAPIATFSTFKPFFLSSMLITKYLDCPIQSYEGALMKIVQDQKEEVLGLETVEEQLNLFENIPYKDQLKDLMTSIEDNLAEDKEKFKTMMTLYNNADLASIQEMTESDDSILITKYKDIILTNRNKKWISKMIAFSKEQPTFFGVGAAHLIGEDGVIKLLRNEGYTVTAVK